MEGVHHTVGDLCCCLAAPRPPVPHFASARISPGKISHIFSSILLGARLRYSSPGCVRGLLYHTGRYYIQPLPYSNCRVERGEPIQNTDNRLQDLKKAVVILRRLGFDFDKFGIPKP